MALPDSIVLDGATTDQFTFTRHSPVSGGTEYLEAAATLSSPHWVRIKHESGPSNTADAVDRHLVQFSRIALDVTGKPFEFRLNTTFLVPRSTITPANITEGIGALRDFLSQSTVMDSVLRGEE